MKRQIIIASLAFGLAAGTVSALTALPQAALADGCGGNGCADSSRIADCDGNGCPLTAPQSGAGLAMAIPVGSELPANGSHANFWQGFSDGSRKAGWQCSASGLTENPNLKVRYDWNGSWEPAQIDWNSFAWQTCSNDWAYGYLNQASADAKRQASADSSRIADCEGSNCPLTAPQSGAGLAMAIPVGSEMSANGSHANFWQGFSDGSRKAGWQCSASGLAENPNLKVRYDWNGSWEPVQIDWNSFAWQTCSNDWAYGYLNQAPADAKRQARADSSRIADCEGSGCPLAAPQVVDGDGNGGGGHIVQLRDCEGNGCPQAAREGNNCITPLADCDGSSPIADGCSGNNCADSSRVADCEGSGCGLTAPQIVDGDGNSGGHILQLRVVCEGSGCPQVTCVGRNCVTPPADCEGSNCPVADGCNGNNCADSSRMADCEGNGCVSDCKRGGCLTAPHVMDGVGNGGSHILLRSACDGAGCSLQRTACDGSACAMAPQVADGCGGSGCLTAPQGRG